MNRLLSQRKHHPHGRDPSARVHIPNNSTFNRRSSCCIEYSTPPGSPTRWPGHRSRHCSYPMSRDLRGVRTGFWLTHLFQSAYISYAENYRYGLRGLSVVLSLPRALTVWGIVFLQVALVTEITTHNQGTHQWDKVAVAGAIPVMLILLALSFFRFPV